MFAAHARIPRRRDLDPTERGARAVCLLIVTAFTKTATLGELETLAGLDAAARAEFWATLDGPDLGLMAAQGAVLLQHRIALRMAAGELSLLTRKTKP